MPNWNQLLDEINAAVGVHDVIRRRYLKEVSELTGRNVIIYYSGWLQKEGIAGIEINDEDKNGFMTVIHELDRGAEPWPRFNLAYAWRRDGRHGIPRGLCEVFSRS